MNRWPRVALGLLLLAGLGCGAPGDEVAELKRSPTAVARETRLERALADPDSTSTGVRPLAQWMLPPGLQEISGLALTTDGRLLLHDDEIGQVWEIDYRRGLLVKRFSLAKGPKGDFEGITVANGVVFLLSSNGKLHEFREGAADKQVGYKAYDTGLKQQCEFEGVAFDPAINSLLLACKRIYDKGLADRLLIYRWSLAADTTARLSQLSIPVESVVGANDWKSLHPSDITVDPLTGNYVMVASKENALISITPAGALVFARPLPARHHQVEGVSITKDNMLIVSDEAGSGQWPAMITLYKWP